MWNRSRNFLNLAWNRNSYCNKKKKHFFSQITSFPLLNWIVLRKIRLWTLISKLLQIILTNWILLLLLSIMLTRTDHITWNYLCYVGSTVMGDYRYFRICSLCLNRLFSVLISLPTLSQNCIVILIILKLIKQIPEEDTISGVETSDKIK